MKKLLLISAFLAFSFDVKAECTATPECTALGYTKTLSDCPKGALKCPYGNSYFCEEICEGSIAIGNILHEDFRVCSNVLKSKKPLGVVVYLDSTGKHGQAIAPWIIDEDGKKTDLDYGMHWGDPLYDIPTLQNHGLIEAATDFESCSNTDKMLAEKFIVDGITVPTIATAAKKYAPTPETKGKWCVPAAGVLHYLHQNLDIIQAGVNKMGGKEIYAGIWSSTEYDAHNAWYNGSFNGSGIELLWIYKDHATFYLQPVIEF